jgi:MYXO-CTERM domain-containing protein
VRRLRVLAALASLLAAVPALAFVRSTTATPGTGKPLFWPNPQVTFTVNPSHFNSIPGCTTSAAAMALVRASIPTWNQATRPGESAVCTSFRFVDGGDSASTVLGYDQTPGAHNENLVVFRSRLCSAITSDAICAGVDVGACVAKYNCWEHDAATGPGGTIALTSVVFLPDTGEIVDADMELHDWNGDKAAPNGWYFTCPGPPALTCNATGPTDPLLYSESGCTFIDIGNTVTHEAGHMLGLDHVCVPNVTGPSAICPVGGSTMEPTAGPGDTDKRTLKPDDVDGVCSIYPVKSSGGCGCGTASASGLALLGLFLAALWPRRRSAQ